MTPADERFNVPLYSVSEAAHHIDVPVSTFRTWTHGNERRHRGRRTVTGEPIVTTLPRDAGVSVPFVGLAEAMPWPLSGARVCRYSASARRSSVCRQSLGSSMSLRRSRSTPTVPKCSTTSRSHRVTLQKPAALVI